MNPATEITRTLRSLRRRMVFRDFLHRTVRASLFFYAVLLILTAAAWWTGDFRPVPAEIPFVLGWPPAAGAVAGLVLALLRIPRLERVARTADALGATRDRLLTALVFSKRHGRTEMESLAVVEAGNYVLERDFRPLLPIRPPRELGWVAAPLAMLAMLWWDAMHLAVSRDQRAAEEQEAIAGTTGGLDRLAAGIERGADASREAELKRLAERLRRSAEQMRAEAARGGDAQKAALRELAMLEQWVRELQQPAAATPEELKALAEALMKHEQTRAAGEDIQGGDLASASRRLAQAAGEQDPQAEEEMRRTIQQALDHLAQRKEQLSRQFEKFRERVNAGDAGREDLLRQIAELLEEQQQSGNVAERKDGNGAGQKGGGKPLTDEELKRLLGALQELKNRQQGGTPDGGEPGQDDDASQSPIAMLNFAPERSADGSAGDGMDFPTGQPGTDDDKGTTKDPFGKQAPESLEAGTRDRLSGRLVAGESLSAAIPGVAAGGTKAARRYKELYNAAAADAEDAVTQENIPLGSRLLIRRYFEAIRPRQ